MVGKRKNFQGEKTTPLKTIIESLYKFNHSHTCSCPGHVFFNMRLYQTFLLWEGRSPYILEQRPGCPAFQLMERCSKSDGLVGWTTYTPDDEQLASDVMVLSQAYKSSLSVSHPTHEACSTPTWYAPVIERMVTYGDMTTYHALQLVMSVSYSPFPPKQTNDELPSILSLPWNLSQTPRINGSHRTWRRLFPRAEPKFPGKSSKVGPY